MQISGHKTRSIFDRCRIESESDLRDAAAMMDQPFPAIELDLKRLEQEEPSDQAEIAPKRPN